MSTPRVLDAWALLAFLQGEEPAATRVRDLLREANEGSARVLMSIINLGEVYYNLGRVRGEEEAEETLTTIRQLPMTILPASDEMVMRAARLKMAHPISYADAFAAAAASELSAVLVTGDPELKRLDGIIALEWLQRDGFGM